MTRFAGPGPRRLLPLLAVVLAAAACGGGPAVESTAEPTAESTSETSGRGLRLAAELRGDDVLLRWDGGRSGGSGVVVEFATEVGGPYTVLEFAPPVRRGHLHPDLMPRTTFHYRVRPVVGPASPAVTPAPGPVAPGGEDWLVPRTVPDDRAAPTPGGAPANLVATTVGGDGVLLAWTDNSTDEEGFLVEAGAGDRFEVVFTVAPDVNAVGLITSGGPQQYRVRSYRLGAPSNVVSEKTGG